MTVDEIRTKAYEAFQMYWMLTHGITISDISKAVGEYLTETGGNPEIPFSAFLEEVGFVGAIWPCFEEFLDNEFRNSDLMHSLLDRETFIAYTQICIAAEQYDVLCQ